MRSVLTAVHVEGKFYALIRPTVQYLTTGENECAIELTTSRVSDCSRRRRLGIYILPQITMAMVVFLCHMDMRLFLSYL